MKIDAGLGTGEVEVMLGREIALPARHYWVGIMEVSGDTVAAAFLRSQSGEDDTDINGTTYLTDGDWHYIVFVRNNDDNTNQNLCGWRLRRRSGQGSTSRPISAFDGWPIHHRLFDVSPFYNFNGAIDEVAVYVCGVAAI